MMKKNLIILSLLGVILMMGCRPEESSKDKYDRPDWLTGKVYTTMLEDPDLESFALCVKRSGYDTIIDRSGSYTVFGPVNEAMTQWLQGRGYASVDDVPLDELRELVRYHIVQNPWTREQLMQLDVWGWIDTLDVNNDEPRGYKRQTILKQPNQKLGVEFHGRDSENEEEVHIVDTLDSPYYRMYLRDSRKFVPIFFKDYFDIYNLSLDDYTFYFDRPIEQPGDLYIGGARVMGDEDFAENGFVYTIDRVVEPMKNAFEILGSTDGGQSYKSFFDLCNEFPSFTYNENETQNQEGADQGLAVDSLFSMAYPDLVFDLLNEETSAPRGTLGLPSDVTIRYHHGVAAPTDEAMDMLEQMFFTGPGKWGSIEEAPTHIKRMIANTHLSTNPIYRTDMETGYLNGEADEVTFMESSIVQKEYGSNCTFVGLNEPIIPRAFTSILGPIYQQTGYSHSMYAIEQAGLAPALKRKKELLADQYMFFVESDEYCKEDSSLLYNRSSEIFSCYTMTAIGTVEPRYNLDVNELRTLLLNHIVDRKPPGVARKEFVKNLAGNYLVFENDGTGTKVSGTVPTTIGYRGDVEKENYPVLISEDADNGETYLIENWFGFSAQNLYNLLKANFPDFTALLVDAGLAKDNSQLLTFLSENENYTIFAATDAALSQVVTDTMDQKELQDFLKLHFVQGDLVFTDGQSFSGFYETTRLDENSSEFNKVYSSVYLALSPDIIAFPGAMGETYTQIPESDSTNFMAGRMLGETDDVFPVVTINAVVHKLDKALIIDELATK